MSTTFTKIMERLKGIFGLGAVSESESIQQASAAASEDAVSDHQADPEKAVAISEPSGTMEEGKEAGTQGQDDTSELDDYQSNRVSGGSSNNSLASVSATARPGSRLPRPKLRCRKNATGDWEVFLVWGNDCFITSVLHDDQALTLGDGECVIPLLHGSLVISYQDGKQTTVPLFTNDNPLVFKLNNSWDRVGNRANRAGQGYHVVFAPSSWKIKRIVGVKLESCIDSNFDAHIIHQKNSKHKDLFEVESRPDAIVKLASGGWIQGKGFSISEIEDAGLNMQDVVDRFIPIDKRRRSSHTQNTEKLMEIHSG